MKIAIQEVTRIYTFNGVNLPDVPGFEPHEIKDMYCGQYPDLVTAAISPPVISADGTTETYTFVRNVGTKG